MPVLFESHPCNPCNNTSTIYLPMTHKTVWDKSSQMSTTQKAASLLAWNLDIPNSNLLTLSLYIVSLHVVIIISILTLNCSGGEGGGGYRRGQFMKSYHHRGESYKLERRLNVDMGGLIELLQYYWVWKYLLAILQLSVAGNIGNICTSMPLTFQMLLRCNWSRAFP